jgi:hypothetical protein
MPSFGVVGISNNDAVERSAHISENHEVIVRQFDYSEPYPLVLAGASSTLANNLVEARASEQFIVTGVIIEADRNIGNTGADTVIYEATASDSTVQSKILFSADILKQTNFAPPIPDAGIKVAQGSYVNVNRDATAGTVRAFLYGYFIPSL